MNTFPLPIEWLNEYCLKSQRLQCYHNRSAATYLHMCLPNKKQKKQTSNNNTLSLGMKALKLIFTVMASAVFAKGFFFFLAKNDNWPAKTVVYLLLVTYNLWLFSYLSTTVELQFAILSEWRFAMQSALTKLLLKAGGQSIHEFKCVQVVFSPHTANRNYS